MTGWELFDKMVKATKPMNVSAEKAKRRDAMVHNEPDCLGYNRCRVLEPHTHGFACDKTCNECHGQCHPDCPANESIEKE